MLDHASMLKRYHPSLHKVFDVFPHVASRIVFPPLEKEGKVSPHKLVFASTCRRRGVLIFEKSMQRVKNEP